MIDILLGSYSSLVLKDSRQVLSPVLMILANKSLVSQLGVYGQT